MAMIFENIRVFKDKGGLSDLSLDNQDDSATLSLDLTTADYLYIGQRLPFSNLYFNVGVANATAATWTIEYWDGSQWSEVVDSLDATSTGGAILARTGNLKYTIDRSRSWLDVLDTSRGNAPTELSTLEIYNMYWLRLTPSVNLDAGTTIKEITYAFTEDQELLKFDIEINKYLAAFDAAKTDWVNEIVTASKLVVTELRRQGLVVNQGQIIDVDDVYLATTIKTLWLIYGHLGPSYNERRTQMGVEFKDALNLTRFTFDTNSDGQLERNELSNQIKRMVR